MNILFFGSFQHYSTKIAQALLDLREHKLVGVVTTPPMPAGRKQVLTQTHTHQWAEQNRLPVFTPVELSQSYLKTKLSNLDIDLFIVAGYGKLLPAQWLKHPKLASLNIHFSLLPKFRGANPAEWAILLNQTETGITLMEMAEEFDTGNILAQTAIEIDSKDTRETLYEKLYDLAAECLPHMLESYLVEVNKKFSPGMPQPPLSPTPPAYRFTRSQSFIPWEIINSVLMGESFDPHKLPAYLQKAWQYTCKSYQDKPATKDYTEFIHNSIRALAGFPGVWTYIPTHKGKQRLKVLTSSQYSNGSNLKLHLEQVQLEGKNPSNFNQLKSVIA